MQITVNIMKYSLIFIFAVIGYCAAGNKKKILLQSDRWQFNDPRMKVEKWINFCGFKLHKKRVFVEKIKANESEKIFEFQRVTYYLHVSKKLRIKLMFYVCDKIQNIFKTWGFTSDFISFFEKWISVKRQ